MNHTHCTTTVETKTCGDWLARLGTLLALALALAHATPVAGQSVDVADLAAMQARNIGPGGMSGRVSDVDVVLSDPTVMYVGAATGGVWKTEDGGVRWTPIFDDQEAIGVGAVQVYQPNPDIVWVGTGEGNPRNSAGVGAGVYRSDDAGASWRRVGLEDSERIHRIVLHPANPDIAYAAALGPAWSDGEERGVFRTTDGGQTWERVLFTNERSGAAELVMDPSNPDRLFAAMWEYRRSPWFFESGGPGSGLYRSEDGGETWVELGEAEGMPAGELGRMGLAFAPSNPEVLYALVEATRSELLRSDDGGRTFETVSDRAGIAPRPFYYADLRVSSEDEDHLYSLHSTLQQSRDGGRSFQTVVPSQIIHGDVHELWIHPDDSRFMIMGNDGGIAITRDQGDSWRFVENLVLAQFYHISVDDAVPFRVYGGLQDNGSWHGPSTVWENRGIMNAHWRRVGGGDGFSVLPDPSDPNHGYAMSQGGNLTRFDRRTGARRSIRPVHPNGLPLRFNWNAALALDPLDDATLYLGSQYVHRTRDGGATWEVISPDLTTNDPEKQRQSMSGGLSLDATGAENHTTLVAIGPSPVNAGLIWAGSDDGRIHVTRNGGETWTDVRIEAEGLPTATWVADIEPSRHDGNRAFAVLDDHRRGNWAPYVFRTDDLGTSWTRLPLPPEAGFAHAVAEDPVIEGLLYVGTEFGLWVSLDAGRSWSAWRHGVPAVPVRDLVVHPRDLDLVLGTHGRGIFILDDVRPLQALAAHPDATSELTLFVPPPAIQAQVTEAVGYRSVGHAMQFAENRRYGALLNWWHPGDPARYHIEVADSTGRVVRTLQGRSGPGLNRVAWDLRAEFEGVPARPEALPGTYEVRLRVGEADATTSVVVHPDPRVPHDATARAAKLAAILEAGALAGRATDVRASLRRLQEAVGRLQADAGLLTDTDVGSAVAAVHEGLTRLMVDHYTGPECQGICGGNVTARTVQIPLRTLQSSRAAPSAEERRQIELAQTALNRITGEVERFRLSSLAELNGLLEGLGRDPLVLELEGDPPG